MKRKLSKTILHILTVRYIVVFAVLFLASTVFIYLFTDEFYRKNIYDPAYNGTVASIHAYMDQLNRMMGAYDLAYGSFIRRLLSDMSGEITKNPNESTDSLEKKLAGFASGNNEGIEGVKRTDFYVISSDGIIEKTNYATDLGLNIPAVIPFYWEKLDSLKTGQMLVDPLVFEKRTNISRIYGYRRLDDGSILEIGLGFGKGDNVFQKITEDVKRIETTLPYVRRIDLYTADFKPYGDGPYPELASTDIKRFGEINGQNTTILRSDGYARILYADWTPEFTDIHSVVHMKIEMNFMTMQLFRFYIILFFAAALGAMGMGMLLIQLLNSKRIVRPFELLSKNMTEFLNTGRYTDDPRLKKTEIREFNELSMIYDQMAKELNSSMQELKNLNTDLSKTVKIKEERETQLRIIATRDELTGLFNRRACFDFLKEEERESVQSGKNFTVCFIDIDNLKTVNDRKGHHVGDELIRTTGSVIKKSIRESDVACRLSGDEFLIIFSDCGIDQATAIWDRIRNRIAFFNGKAADFEIRVSHGYAEFDPVNPVSVDELVKRADIEMYIEKKTHKENDSKKLTEVE